MTLVRSQGIPAKWQSGWMLHPGEVNLHDWCEVYFEGVGWVPVDQSFGLQDSPDEKVRNFYRSGIDSYRLIVNDDYARKLTRRRNICAANVRFSARRAGVGGREPLFDQWKWHMEKPPLTPPKEGNLGIAFRLIFCPERVTYTSPGQMRNECRPGFGNAIRAIRPPEMMKKAFPIFRTEWDSP